MCGVTDIDRHALTQAFAKVSQHIQTCTYKYSSRACMQPQSIVTAQLRALPSNGQYFEAQSFDTLTSLSDDILTAVGKALIVCVQPMYRLIYFRFDYNFESVIYSMLFTFWQACKTKLTGATV